MGDHAVLSATWINALRFDSSIADRCSIFLPWRDGRLSWP